MLVPTDLASFLDLIRQHGDAAYSIMFAYAASHSLLLALFAGYAAHSGALQLGTLILVCWFGSFAGDAVRFWIGRRFGTSLVGSFPRVERAVRRPMVLRRRLGWLCLRPGLREAHERRFFRHWRADAGRIPRPLLDFEQKARARRRAELRCEGELIELCVEDFIPSAERNVRLLPQANIRGALDISAKCQ